MHVWLPEAHPAAPSPVSALMSGVMLKTALYGLLRVTFDLLGEPLWWWGLMPLALGLFTAMYGVIFAAAQTDMKRLLAYSSIENIGIIFTGVGLAICSPAPACTLPRRSRMIAVLYHALNHAFMKSLLFLGTGAVLHATGERNLGRLGGLDPSDALGCMADAGGSAGDRRAAAAQRLRVRVVAAAVVSVRPRSCRERSSTCCCRWARRCSCSLRRSPAT